MFDEKPCGFAQWVNIACREFNFLSCPQNWEEDEDDEDMDTKEARQNHADEEMREDSKANGDESDLDPENESEEE